MDANRTTCIYTYPDDESKKKHSGTGRHGEQPYLQPTSSSVFHIPSSLARQYGRSLMVFQDVIIFENFLIPIIFVLCSTDNVEDNRAL